ncbi:uncharacterized protein A4U43_C08F2400 [Asparagus officinalis]|uniref:putative uncharacterized protein YGR160W n=1 Tax=Asparagus officinalis TaxID=4686 RepID=UPI00098E61FA|nr:putative uncharacterized protein YGR160W [Asparagus officinalis]ONK59045.1 uncharacterized protein A4U43_C08F2400 [Asparagus officinalis]
MASSPAVLHKKLEELEAQINNILPQNPMQLPHNNLAVYQINKKFEFIKTLLNAESNSADDNSNNHLEEIGNRLSIVENNFIAWVDSGAEKTESNLNDLDEEIAERLSFIESNFTYLNSSDQAEEKEDVDDDDDDDDEKEEEEEVDQDSEVSDVTEEVILSKANIEKIVAEVTERVREKEKRRGRWLTRLGVMAAAAAVAAVGVAMAGIESVEETVYLVPT